ncbi:MAG: tyrosine-type recombinase/integrase [Spirochaetia bacterium]|jgi:integrase
MQFSSKAARRGVLAEEEVERLFARPWFDERAWLRNALALSTGLRQGEVLAVQVRDIADDRLLVRHAWSNLDGLKAPKTGEERTVPLMLGLRAVLLDLARKNPHGVGPASFVFWSVDRADRPMDAHGLLDPLKAALLRLTLTDDDAKDPEKVKQAETYWRSRRVCFHSWRHLYAARMADRLEARKVMSATGHKSGAVFEVYADHASEKVFQEVSAAAADTFGKLVTFPAAGASAKNGRVGGVVRGDGCGRVPGLPSRVPALLSCPGMRSQGERRAGTRDSNPSTPL